MTLGPFDPVKFIKNATNIMHSHSKKMETIRGIQIVFENLMYEKCFYTNGKKHKMKLSISYHIYKSTILPNND